VECLELQRVPTRIFHCSHLGSSPHLESFSDKHPWIFSSWKKLFSSSVFLTLEHFPFGQGFSFIVVLFYCREVTKHVLSARCLYQNWSQRGICWEQVSAEKGLSQRKVVENKLLMPL